MHLVGLVKGVVVSVPLLPFLLALFFGTPQRRLRAAVRVHVAAALPTLPSRPPVLVGLNLPARRVLRGRVVMSNVMCASTFLHSLPFAATMTQHRY